MIRKFAFAAAAIAALGTASLALAAPAFAKGGGHHGHHGGHFRGGGGVGFVTVADTCYEKEVVVVNRRGKVVGVRTINVCD